MNFIEATKYCFANYARFSGRADRYEFWNFILFIVLAQPVLSVLNSVVFGPTITRGIEILFSGSGQQEVISYTKIIYDGGWLSTIFTALIIVPLLAVTWRRMHDTGRKGWYSLLPIVIAALSYGLIVATSSPLPIDSSIAPESVSMPEVIDVPRWPLVILAGLASIASAILVIAWLARAPDPNSNQFGPGSDEDS